MKRVFERAAEIKATRDASRTRDQQGTSQEGVGIGADPVAQIGKDKIMNILAGQ